MQKMMHFYKEVHHISMVCRVFHIFRVILDNWTLLETNTEQLNQILILIFINYKNKKVVNITLNINDL